MENWPRKCHQWPLWSLLSWKGEDGNQLEEDPRYWRQGIHLLCLSCPKLQTNPVPPEASETMSVPEDTPLWTFQQGPLFFKLQRILKSNTGDKSLSSVSFQIFSVSLFDSANMYCKDKTGPVSNTGNPRAGKNDKGELTSVMGRTRSREKVSKTDGNYNGVWWLG